MSRLTRTRSLTPALVVCLAAAAPAIASADSDRGRDRNARVAQAGQPIYFKPGTYKGQTTQDLPVSFKATKKRLSRFSAEIELHCYSPAPAGSGQQLVHERSYRETFTLPNGKYRFGATTKRRNYFRFSEQPDANTSFSSAAVFLKGKRAYGDLYVRRTEGQTECQSARRDTATGEPTELTSSFEIRRRGRRPSGLSPGGDEPSGQKARRCASRTRGTPARKLALRLSKARGEAAKRRALLGIMDALNIGVYRGSGRPVKRGSERSGSDPFLYDFELSIIAHKLLRNERSSYRQLAHFLSTAGVKPASRPLTGDDVQGMIVKATRSAQAHPRQRLSLLPLLVRELGCTRARKDDTARRGKLETPRLDAAQLALVLFDLAAGGRAQANDAAAVQQAAAASAPDTDCYGIGHPNPDTMRLGKYAIALTPVLGTIDMLYTAINDGVHGMVVSWAIDVQPTRGGQVDTTHYGPAGHAVDAGKPLVFQIGVQMTWQPPEHNVRCGPLIGLKYPQKGPMAGVPVAWDAFFSGFDKLMEHGVILRQDTETGPDGIAVLVVQPNDEAPDAIRSGKVVTERGDLEPQVRVLGSLGSTIGVANDPLFAPSFQWSVTFHVPLRDYDFCLDRNEMPIPCPT